MCCFRSSPWPLCTAFLALCTACSSIATLAWAVTLKLRLGRLKANTAGDPEKGFVDECMRDFEGLPMESQQFVDNHLRCIEELMSLQRLHMLPRVRLTVDDQICSQANLCASSDPGQCADRGEFVSPNYVPGDVTKCYELIDQYRAELSRQRRAGLFTQVEQQCTRPDKWGDYAHKVQLRYCMWKHFAVGVCMNSMRTNCPQDTSCCPVAQGFMGEAAVRRPARPNVYACRKSPTVGLYCQHEDDCARGNSTGGGCDEPCTAETCPSFSWCLDLIDVPGLCLGAACQDYQRCVTYTAVLIALASLGLCLDFVEMVALLRWCLKPQVKYSLNMAAASLKLMGFACCLAGGIRELIDTAIEQACFNDEGNQSIATARAGAYGFLASALLAGTGSLCLAPLSARAGGHPELPYAKVRPEG